MGVLDGLFGTSHKAMNKEGGGFLGKLLEAITGGGNKPQSFSPNQNYHRTSSDNNNNSGGNSGNSSWGGSNSVGINKYDKFFDKSNNTMPVYSAVGAYAAGAAAGSVVHHAVQYVTDVVEMPVYVGADMPYDDPFMEFNLLGLVAPSVELPFFNEAPMEDIGFIPPAANVNVAVNLQKDTAIAV